MTESLDERIKAHKFKYPHGGSDRSEAMQLLDDLIAEREARQSRLEQDRALAAQETEYFRRRIRSLEYGLTDIEEIDRRRGL